MTPKQRREKLFKETKPFVRKVDQDDFKWLYGAYRYPKGPGDEEDQQAFIKDAIETLSAFDEAYIIEDKNSKYKGKYGSVGLVPCMYNGWMLEPHVEWFPWATKLNRIRGTIAFVMFTRYSNDVGVTLYKSLDDTKDFFRKLKKYAPIYPIRGKIPFGDHRGDVYQFYTRGRKRNECC